MDEKKVELTDEEIVQSLVHCSSNCSCEDCYHNDEVGSGEIVCRARLMIKALDLIHRLQDENEKLKTFVSHFEQLEKQLSAEIERLTREVDKQKNFVSAWEESWKIANEQNAKIRVKLKKENGELQKQVDELKNRFENKACCTMSENCSMVQQAVKDTADKIYDFVKEYYSSDEDIFGERLKEFIEQYGVEVE